MLTTTYISAATKHLKFKLSLSVEGHFGIYWLTFGIRGQVYVYVGNISLCGCLCSVYP